MILFTVLLLGVLHAFGQDVYSCRNANLSFFSSAPLEDIEAKTDKGVAAINAKTGAIYFKVPVNTFQFKKKLMQEHFNENYLETEKYPWAEFKGKLSGPIDCTKNGTYDVTVDGNMTIHGVQKAYTEKGTVTVNNGQLTATCKFNVKLEDHKIKIPTLVIKNIAEVVEVTVNATYIAAATAAK
ncbi:YceI family protein [Chitinophaga agrisoli]|uniref:YceI family protein n=1 Tax=Chitinophaga agrisoli TaxID=2607653 RepID=A0A5B2W6F0_9BACT|nr:YceI family protein [Chitinophaga agrisoli]